MKIISAIGSFKGTVNSVEINALAKSFFEARGHTVEAIPVADGGDGLLEALCFSLGGERVAVDTVDALGRSVKAEVVISGNRGVAEMALASGLALLGEDELNPLEASTYGTGLLLRYFAEKGVSSVILGIGGSATNDGGMGCLNALGFRFYDCDGLELSPRGASLERVYRICGEAVPHSVRSLDITIACDVTNPLLGDRGATYVYGGQKGADRDMLVRLEKGMENYAKAVADYCGCDCSALSGTGAAGGLGFGLMAMLGAKLEKGAELVLSAAGYVEKLSSADLVITGEGRLDSQTAYGKLPQLVAQRARDKGVSCVALCGSCTADGKSLEAMGIERAYQLTDYAPISECMENTREVVCLALSDLARKI